MLMLNSGNWYPRNAEEKLCGIAMPRAQLYTLLLSQDQEQEGKVGEGLKEVDSSAHGASRRQRHTESTVSQAGKASGAFGGRLMRSSQRRRG